MSRLTRTLLPLALLSAALGVFWVISDHGSASSAPSRIRDHGGLPASPPAADNPSSRPTLSPLAVDHATSDEGAFPAATAAAKTSDAGRGHPSPVSAVPSSATLAGPLTIASVLAHDLRDLPLTAEQRQEIAQLANFFIDEIGDPGTGSPRTDQEFSQRVRDATAAVDSVIKQRHGHRAFVQLQRKAGQELSGR